MKKKLSIHQKTEIYTYAYIRNSNYTIVNLIKNGARGKNNLAMTSMIMSAFTFEGYCNHLGVRLIDHWKEIDRISLMNKVSILLMTIKEKIDWSQSPWQDIKYLMTFRDLMAHARSEIIEVKKEIKVSNYDDDDFVQYANAKWQKMLSADAALRCYNSVRVAVEWFELKSGSNDIPFNMGMSEKYSSIVAQPEN